MPKSTLGSVWPTPRRLADCHNLADLRALAKRRLPSPIFHYLEGGAEDETTLDRNLRAFDEIGLVPNALVDVASVDTATRVLEQDLGWPVFCSPTGASRFCHADGELAVARACAAMDTLYGVSTMATYGLEAIAAAASGPKLFQLYIFKDRGITRALIARARAAGYGALCLTVDVPVTGKRERDLRTGWGIPIRLSPASIASFALHPAWLARQARRGRLSMPTVAAASGSDDLRAQTRFIGAQLDPSVTWADAAEIVKLWKGPVAIKGIMSVADARRAADIGASAVIVSNHGGRQLDGAVGALDALPDIAAAVRDRVDVILDGGIRRGSHVLKALALGATACSVGRPYLYGLSAGGEEGVRKALALLRGEFVRAMQLSGCARLDDIGPHLVRQLPAPRR
jgi:L-lactate dehydrogenase (cytochrome)